MTSPDVLVIGGGAIGCALARELSVRGRSVLVMERGQPGGEASGAAAGLLSPQSDFRRAGPLFDLARESHESLPGVGPRGSGGGGGPASRLPQDRPAPLRLDEKEAAALEDYSWQAELAFVWNGGARRSSRLD